MDIFCHFNFCCSKRNGFWVWVVVLEENSSWSISSRTFIRVLKVQKVFPHRSFQFPYKIRYPIQNIGRVSILNSNFKSASDSRELNMGRKKKYLNRHFCAMSPCKIHIGKMLKLLYGLQGIYFYIRKYLNVKPKYRYFFFQTYIQVN